LKIFSLFDIYFSSYSFNNISQTNQSTIEISTEHIQNLIFDDYAIQTNDDKSRSSSIKIAFEHSRGTLQMSTNTFSLINNGKKKKPTQSHLYVSSSYD